MKKFLWGTIVLALVSIFPFTTMAGVDVSIGISIPLPPPVAFEAPPDVVALPDTNGVYVAPNVNVDIFFWNGFWWRPWEGRWYRSPYYDRGWAYFDSVPKFYYDVDPYWRGYYQNHTWHGHIWNYQPIPHSQLQKNWKNWQSNRSWGNNQRTWGVQGYTPKPQQQRQILRQQRQTIYEQKPEVQKHQQFQKQQGQQPNKGASHQQPRGHEGRGEEHGR